MSKKKNIPDHYKLSKKLDPFIKNYYKNEIGVPDTSQNYLELFNRDIIDDLFTIMHNNSDNQLKSDYVTELLEPFGFTEKGGGLGTNIVTLTHPHYPGVVFKIALDENGIADNFNDCLLQDMIPRYARVYARHPSSLVTVQERYFVMKPEWMNFYRADILRLLKALSKDYLIADLTPSMFLNYGIGRDGGFIFIDGSDLYPLKQIKSKDRLRCVHVVGSDKNGNLKRCKGKCHYNDDFSQMVCEKCGRTYIPIELRPKKEEVSMRSIFTDGLDFDEREEFNRLQREAIRNGVPFDEYIPHHEDPEEPDDDEMEVNEMDIPNGYHVQTFRTKEKTYKILVQDGYHVVAIKDNQPIVKKDREDFNKPANDIKENDIKKDKNIKHHPQPFTTYVKKKEEPEPEEHKKPKVSESYEEKILNIKEKFPEDFKVYVSQLVDIIGWDMIDKIREETNPTDKTLEVSREDLQKAVKILKNRNTDLMEQVKELNEKNVFIAELESTIKMLEDTITVRNKEIEELTNQNSLLAQQIKVLEKRVIKNETSNSIIQKMQSDENPNCIHYQVIEETEQESSDLPGIYYHIRGDVIDAYENYGIPIYVVVDGITSLAVTSKEMSEYIYDAFDDINEDSNTPAVIVESEDIDDVVDDNVTDSSDIDETLKQEEELNILRDYTTIMDEDEDNEEEDDDEGDYMTEEEENDLIFKLMDNINPNTDPRYELAQE